MDHTKSDNIRTQRIENRFETLFWRLRVREWETEWGQEWRWRRRPCCWLPWRFWCRRWMQLDGLWEPTKVGPITWTIPYGQKISTFTMATGFVSSSLFACLKICSLLALSCRWLRAYWVFFFFLHGIRLWIGSFVCCLRFGAPLAAVYYVVVICVSEWRWQSSYCLILVLFFLLFAFEAKFVRSTNAWSDLILLKFCVSCLFCVCSF